MQNVLNDIIGNNFVHKLTFDIVFFRLLLAIIFGGLVGIEREKNNRPAGFRTHILVCFGSAIISMVQDQLRINILDFAKIAGPETAGLIRADIGRLGAQVISGIGFLGAGSIMKDKGETIGGMTTAAGIWATGCVGLGIGWGFYNIAFIAIGFMLVVMISFKKVEYKLIRRARLIKFIVKYNSYEELAPGMLESYEVFREKSIKVAEVDKNIEDNVIVYSVSMKGRNNISEIIIALSASKFVEYVKDNI